MRRLAAFSLILSLALLCVSMSRPARAGDTVLEPEACTSLLARRVEVQAELDRLDQQIAVCSSDAGAAVPRLRVPSARAARRKQSEEEIQSECSAGARVRHYAQPSRSLLASCTCQKSFNGLCWVPCKKPEAGAETGLPPFFFFFCWKETFSKKERWRGGEP